MAHPRIWPVLIAVALATLCIGFVVGMFTALYIIRGGS
jgi:hypothetical protein